MGNNDKIDSRVMGLIPLIGKKNASSKAKAKVLGMFPFVGTPVKKRAKGGSITKKK